MRTIDFLDKRVTGICNELKKLSVKQKFETSDWLIKDVYKRQAYISGKISVHGALQIGTRRISGLLQQPQNQGKTKGLAACRCV